ncbi:hypothetical protein [Candidatus Neptunichlamydia sp. REUL1]|uniref:hypothetical protein n=1 Tax=Candidatus Neptunichlamydia sp. REUL1 TaxID=3064277 RepID=UPI00292E2165|nr:hypothetical protein [Candidatus Neptunochlamydia sp. REUL1]
MIEDINLNKPKPSLPEQWKQEWNYLHNTKANAGEVLLSLAWAVFPILNEFTQQEMAKQGNLMNDISGMDGFLNSIQASFNRAKDYPECIKAQHDIDNINNDYWGPGGSNIEKAPAGSNIEDPPAGSNIEDPPAGSNIEDPPAGSNIEKAPADMNDLFKQMYLLHNQGVVSDSQYDQFMGSAKELFHYGDCGNAWTNPDGINGAPTLNTTDKGLLKAITKDQEAEKTEWPAHRIIVIHDIVYSATDKEMSQEKAADPVGEANKFLAEAAWMHNNGDLPDDVYEDLVHQIGVLFGTSIDINPSKGSPTIPSSVTNDSILKVWGNAWGDSSSTDKTSEIGPYTNAFTAVSSRLNSQSSEVQAQVKYLQSNAQQYEGMDNTMMNNFISLEKQANSSMKQ